MGNIIVRETSAEIRAIGRNSLSNKWLNVFWGILIYAALTTFIPQLLDALIPGITNPYGDQFSFYANQYGAGVNYKLNIASSLYLFVLMGPIELGMVGFLLNFFRKSEIDYGSIFSGFERLFKAFALFFMMGLFVFLWSLLLVIPGIIAAIRYSQAIYILYDHPEMGVMECINESKRMMIGNKARYFCLNLSFIGYYILGAICVAILAMFFGFLVAILPLEFMFVIASFLASIPLIVVMEYVKVSQTAFYELAAGNLQAKPQFNESDYHFDQN